MRTWNSVEDMLNDFEATGIELREEQVLFDAYNTPSYEGYAFVLIERDGKLYEVNGSHCSCYGLEGQWDEEETTKEALIDRFNREDYWDGAVEELSEREAVLEILRKL